MTILTSPILPWDMKHVQLCEIWAGHEGGDVYPMTHGLNDGPASDLGNGLVSFPSLGAPFVVGSYVTITGTDNYDGDYIVQGVDGNSFSVYAAYVAETFDPPDEVVQSKIHPGCSFRVLEVRFHMDGVGDDEVFAIMLDAGNHAYNDITLDSQNMNGLTQYIFDWSEQKRFFNKTDSIYFTHTNTLERAWGLEVKYQVYNDISH